jgi:hypothetical protein
MNSVKEAQFASFVTQVMKWLLGASSRLALSLVKMAWWSESSVEEISQSASATMSLVTMVTSKAIPQMVMGRPVLRMVNVPESSSWDWSLLLAASARSPQSRLFQVTRPASGCSRGVR